MRDFPDVNILIALVDDEHAHHRRASDWVESDRRQKWATCPITQNGCLRIMSQPRYSNSMSIAEAMRRLHELTYTTDHEFIADDISLLTEGVIDIGEVFGHRQLTDVYLLALAVAHDLQFVTLDRGVRMETVRGASKEHLAVI